MKKKFLNMLIILSCIFILFQIIQKKLLIFSTIGYSLELWISNVVPSLFPFFILSDILISYRITNYIPNFIKKLFQILFRVSEYGISIFFLSMLSGFPSSARNVKKYYDDGFISLEEANHILTFTHFSNPLFILSTVSVLFFENEKIGIPILLSHYLGNVFIGILNRNQFDYSTKNNYTKEEEKSQNFGKILSHSIVSSIDTLLLILGTLTCFLVLSSIIMESFHFTLYQSSIIKCILEITMGLKSLSLLPISEVFQVVLTSMVISFGGLSVHMQIISPISDTDISYSNFFISRIYHAMIAGVLSYVCYFIMISFF